MASKSCSNRKTRIPTSPRNSSQGKHRRGGGEGEEERDEELYLSLRKEMGLERSFGGGVTQIWKLWRHCCCRYGWYPLLVAPIVTIASLLDLVATLDCQFMRVQVGFTPANQAWNQSTADLGLFFLQSAVLDGGATNNTADAMSPSLSLRNGGSIYAPILFPGCQAYQDDFDQQFIDGDRTWQVARIMAFISISAATVATVTAWLMVCSPIPACFFWPGVLLPAVMIAFLAEGSKFLFLDTAICHSSLWYQSPDAQPVVAESCILGRTSYITMAAGVSFFICLLMVCLKSPEKRVLQEGYGEHYLASLSPLNHHSSSRDDNDDNENNNNNNPSAHGGSDARRSSEHSTRPDESITAVYGSEPHSDRKQKYTRGSILRRKDSNVSSNGGSKLRINSSSSTIDPESGITSPPRRSFNNKSPRWRDLEARHDSTKNFGGGVLRESRDAKDVKSPLSTGTERRDGGSSSSRRRDFGELPMTSFDVPPSTTSPPEGVEMLRVSHARAAKVELMQLNTKNSSDELIEKCVQDLQKAFQSDVKDSYYDSTVDTADVEDVEGEA